MRVLLASREKVGSLYAARAPSRCDDVLHEEDTMRTSGKNGCIPLRTNGLT